MRDILALILIVGASLGPGLFMVSRLLRLQRLDAFHLVVSSAVGLGLLDLILLVMALGGLLTPLNLKVLISALFLLSFLYMVVTQKALAIRLKAILRRPSRGNGPEMLIVAVLLVITVLNVLAALSPSLYWDDIAYHLPLARDFIRSGHLTVRPYIPHSFMPAGPQLLFAAAMGLSSDRASNLIHFHFGFLIMLAIVILGIRVYNLRAGLVGGLIFYSMPVLAWLSPISYVDLIASAYAFLGASVALVHPGSSSRRGLFLSALLFGFGFAIKYSVLLFPIFIIPMVLFMERKNGRPHKWLTAFICLLPQALMVLPWAARSYVVTGTPFWPYLASISPDASMRMLGADFARSFTSFAEVSRNIPNLIVLPFTTVFRGSLFDSSAGPLLLSLAPAYLLARRNTAGRLDPLIIASLLYAVAWFFTGPQLRFLVPVLAALSLAAGCGFAALSESIHASRPALLLLIAAALFNIAYTGDFGRERAQQTRLLKSAVGAGLIQETLYYESLDIYHAARYVNSADGGRMSILGIHENRGYLFEADLVWCDSWLETRGLSVIPDTGSLLREGIGWVVVSGDPGRHRAWLTDGIARGRLLHVAEGSRGNLVLLRIAPVGDNSTDN